jgi:predicted ribosome quality control (RQC) complex YloA/Tae2 family protein
MSLRYDEALPLLDWLRGELEGASVQEVRVPEPQTALLGFRSPGRSTWLLVAVGAGRARFHTVPSPAAARPGGTGARPERAEHARRAAAGFQALLRRELRGRLAGMDLLGGDRILRLRVETPDGDSRSLIVEFLDRHGNILLLDEADVVLGGSLPARGTLPRQVRGQRWLPPPAPSAAPPALQGGPDKDRFRGRDGAARDAAVRQTYEAGLERADRDHERGRIAKVLRDGISTLRRRAAKQLDEASRGDATEELRRRADCLQGAFHLLRKGLAELVVPDLWDPQGGVRKIVLDPSLAPREQVERLYRDARRAERAGKEAGRRLRDTQSELALAEALLDELRAAADLAALADIETRLPPSVLRRRKLRAAAAAGRQDYGTEGRLPYRSQWTKDGIEIRVGRGAADNDALTFRHARGNDVWMHVRGRPGAHVVVRDRGSSPPLPLLLLAAQLALAASGIADGASAELAWARVKDVQKPKGMAPGAVLLRTEKVLYVRADRRALEALLPEPPAGGP